MRMAFLPLTMMLLGGVAWGQATNAPAQDKSLAPSLEQPSQSTAAQPIELKLQQKLGLMQAQIERRLRTQRAERPAASRPEQIPTQWPHAKLEPIPTQWKAQVVLVGPARPAKGSGKAAPAVVMTPK